jgi:hypothetical protein
MEAAAGYRFRRRPLGRGRDCKDMTVRERAIGGES